MFNKQLVEDLRATREVLISRGRCTGDLMKMDGKVCLDGAIGIATIDDYQHIITMYGSQTGYMSMHLNERCKAVVRSLHQCLPKDFVDTTGSSMVAHLFNFNDDPVTTDQDVLGLVDKALAQEGGLAD